MSDNHTGDVIRLSGRIGKLRFQGPDENSVSATPVLDVSGTNFPATSVALKDSPVSQSSAYSGDADPQNTAISPVHHTVVFPYDSVCVPFTALSIQLLLATATHRRPGITVRTTPTAGHTAETHIR